MTGPVRLLGPADVRSIAAELEIRPTKRLGQNFVIDPNTIRRIVAAAGLAPGQRVLEIGPGLGSLTLGLLDVGADVVAVEIDARLAARLPRTIGDYAAGASIDVLTQDALRVPGREIDDAGAAPTALVANLPYNVSVPVLVHLLRELPSLGSGLVMVQQEVAERIAAVPGGRAYGVPSAKLAWFGRWEIAGLIGPTVFWPAPNVGSALLRYRASARPGDDRLRSRVFETIEAAFSARRKTLRQALAGYAGSPAAAEEALAAAAIAPSERAERLGLDDFIRIAEAIPTH